MYGMTRLILEYSATMEIGGFELVFSDDGPNALKREWRLALNDKLLPELVLFTARTDEGEFEASHTVNRSDMWARVEQAICRGAKPENAKPRLTWFPCAPEQAESRLHRECECCGRKQRKG